MKKAKKAKRSSKRPSVKKSNNTFYAFLLMGLAFFAAGMTMRMDALSIVGVAFVAIGLENLNWFMKK